MIAVVVGVDVAVIVPVAGNLIARVELAVIRAPRSKVPESTIGVLMTMPPKMATVRSCFCL